MPVLRELHWLPVACRITYKVLCLVYKALHEISAPAYLRSLLCEQGAYNQLVVGSLVWARKWTRVALQCWDHSGGTSFLQKLWWQSVRGLRTQDVEFPSIASPEFLQAWPLFNKSFEDFSVCRLFLDVWFNFSYCQAHRNQCIILRYTRTQIIIIICPPPPVRVRVRIETGAKAGGTKGGLSAFSAADSCSRSPGHHRPWTMKYHGPYSCYEQSHVHPLFSLRVPLLSDAAFSLLGRYFLTSLQFTHISRFIYWSAWLTFTVRPGLGQYLPSPISLALVDHLCITHPSHTTAPPLH